MEALLQGELQFLRRRGHGTKRPRADDDDTDDDTGEDDDDDGGGGGGGGGDDDDDDIRSAVRRLGDFAAAVPAHEFVHAVAGLVAAHYSPAADARSPAASDPLDHVLVAFVELHPEHTSTVLAPLLALLTRADYTYSRFAPPWRAFVLAFAEGAAAGHARISPTNVLLGILRRVARERSAPTAEKPAVAAAAAAGAAAAAAAAEPPWPAAPFGADCLLHAPAAVSAAFFAQELPRLRRADVEALLACDSPEGALLRGAASAVLAQAKPPGSDGGGEAHCKPRAWLLWRFFASPRAERAVLQEAALGDPARLPAAFAALAAYSERHGLGFEHPWFVDHFLDPLLRLLPHPVPPPPSPSPEAVAAAATAAAAAALQPPAPPADNAPTHDPHHPHHLVLLLDSLLADEARGDLLFGAQAFPLFVDRVRALPAGQVRRAFFARWVHAWGTALAPDAQRARVLALLQLLAHAAPGLEEDLRPVALEVLRALLARAQAAALARPELAAGAVSGSLRIILSGGEGGGGSSSSNSNGFAEPPALSPAARTAYVGCVLAACAAPPLADVGAFVRLVRMEIAGLCLVGAHALSPAATDALGCLASICTGTGADRDTAAAFVRTLLGGCTECLRALVLLCSSSHRRVRLDALRLLCFAAGVHTDAAADVDDFGSGTSAFRWTAARAAQLVPLVCDVDDDVRALAHVWFVSLARAGGAAADAAIRLVLRHAAALEPTDLSALSACASLAARLLAVRPELAAAARGVLRDVLPRAAAAARTPFWADPPADPNPTAVQLSADLAEVLLGAGGAPSSDDDDDDDVAFVADFLALRGRGRAAPGLALAQFRVLALVAPVRAFQPLLLRFLPFAVAGLGSPSKTVRGLAAVVLQELALCGECHSALRDEFAHQRAVAADLGLEFPSEPPRGVGEPAL